MIDWLQQGICILHTQKLIFLSGAGGIWGIAVVNARIHQLGMGRLIAVHSIRGLKLTVRCTVVSLRTAVFFDFDKWHIVIA